MFSSLLNAFFQLDTRLPKSRAGLGAVMKKAYSSIWAEAPENAKNAKKANSDRPTDRPTNTARD